MIRNTISTASTPEFNRMLAAAVVSEKFRQLLLSNPALALKNGYNGTFFSLSTEEEMLVVSTRAASLNSFVTEMANNRAGPKNGHCRNDHS